MTVIAEALVRSNPVAYRQDITTGAHRVVADEPLSAGGKDAGPAPYDYVLAGLGACTAITLQMYAGRKGWDLSDLVVELTFSKDLDGKDSIERVLRSKAMLTDEQWSRLLDIAGKTPVTKTLMAGTPITTQRGTDAPRQNR